MENDFNLIYESLLKEFDVKALGEQVIRAIASDIVCFNIKAEKVENHFHHLDVFNSTLLKNGLPVPLIARDRVLELTKARIKHTKDTCINSQSKGVKNRRIKNELLSYMVNLVAVGETVERASELVAGYCKDTYNSEYQMKASSLEKLFPKYANTEGRSGKTHLESTKFVFDLYDAGVFPNDGRGNHYPDFWRKVRKMNENFKLPDELKGSRRE